MATPKILIKRSNVAGRVPTSLDSGELALNTADGKIYYTGHDGSIHAFMDSAGVNTLINNSVSTLDSANVTDMIDSNYIQTRQITYTLPTLGNDFVDSAQVQAIINAAYVKNIIDSAYVASIVETDGDITITITNEITSTVDSAYVQARVDATDFLDSAEALALIDSDYILARADSAYIKTVTGIDADLFDGQNSTFYRNYNNLTNRPTILDNVDVENQIDSNYVRLRQDFRYSSLTGKPNILDSANVVNIINSEGLDSDLVTALVDSAYISLRDRFQDSSLVTSTVDAAYVQARQIKYLDSEAVKAITLDSSEISTVVTSGYVQARQDFAYGSLTGAPTALSDFTNDVITSTSDVSEGSRLYFTNDRVRAISLDSEDATNLIDSAYIQARQSAGTDSAATIALITSTVDSAYVQLRETAGAVLPSLGNDFVDSAEALKLIDANALDSARATSLIDSAYVQLRQTAQDFAYSSLTGAPTTVSSFTNDANYLDSTTVLPLIPKFGTDYVDSSTVIDIINSEGLDSDLVIALVDSAYIQLRDRFQDSSLVTSTVDQTYIRNRETPNPVLGTDFVDSGQVELIVDSDYVRLKTRIGDSDIDFGSHKITYSNVYSNVSDLPDASTYHGMFAHVHATGAGYFAHGGNWIRLANQSEIFDGTYGSLTGTPTIPALGTDFIDSAQALILIDANALDSGRATALVDSAYVQLRQTAQDFAYGSLTGTPTIPVLGTDFIDSAEALKLIDANALDSGRATTLIDSAYVQLRQSAGTDSAATIDLILATVDSDYIQSRETAGAVIPKLGTDFVDSDQVRLIVDSAYIQAREAANQVDSDLINNVSLSITTFKYTATSGQTVFTNADDNNQILDYHAGHIRVSLNGILLIDSDDYTATNGRTVTLLDSALLNDVITIEKFRGRDVGLDSTGVSNLIDSAYVQARQSATLALGTDFVDSAQTLILIDANALDSGRATSLIDSAYVQLRQDFAYSSLTGAPTIPTIDTDFVDSARVLRMISNEALDSDLTIALVDSAYIQLRDRFQDSSLVTSTVNQSYVRNLETPNPVLGTDFIDSAQALILIDANALDSGRATSLVDSAFVEARQKKGSLYIDVSNADDATRPNAGTGTNSIAIGVNARAQDGRAGGVIIGDSATGGGAHGVVIGKQANGSLTAGANYIEGVAIGYNATIDSGNRTTAIGANSQVRGSLAVALGTRAKATEDNTIAIGVDAEANHARSFALGRYAHTTASSQLMIGANKSDHRYTSVIFGNLDYEPADSLDVPTKRYVDSQITTVIDSAYVQARQSATLSLGTDFIDSAQANILINSIVDSNGLNFIRVKSGSTEEPIISGHSGVGIGNNAKSTGNYGTAIGYNPEASTNSVAIGGFGAKAQSIYSVAIGDRAVTSSGHNYSVALGKAAETTAANQIMLGAKDNSLFRVTSVRIGNPNYEPTDSMDVPTKKYVDSQITTVIDSAYITSRETAQDFAYSSLTGTPTIPALGTDFVDSTQALILIDANALDSGRATALIDSAYIELRRPPEAVFGVTNSVPGYYDFDGDGFSSTAQNPDIYLQRGKTYKFEVNASGHPFQIRSSAGGSAYNTGVTNNGAQSGNILFTPDFSAPDVLFYQCTAHSNMVGRIYIFDVNTFVDSAFVTSRIPALGTDFIDSAQALILIDANALDSARATSLINSSYIQSRQSLIDSALTTSLIDSAYVQARTTAGTDSSATIALIEATVDSAYVQLREAAGGGGGGIDSAATIALIDSNYVQARQSAAAIDSALTLDLVRANSLDSAQSLALFSAHGMTVNTFVYTADSIGKLVYEGADDNSNVMSFTKASKNFRVSLNGILLIDSDDFTAVDNKITLIDAPNASDVLAVETFSGTQGVGGMSTFRYTATDGQLTFSGNDVNSSNLNYKPGDLIVSLNGIILIDSAEYTATDGTSIVLNDSAAVNDELLISTFTPDIERKWTERSASISVGSNTKNIVDCSGGAITVTFPLSPVFGDEIRVIDGTGNAATNNITINRNGNKIQGAADNFIIDVNRAAVGFVYYNAAQGWILIEN